MSKYTTFIPFTDVLFPFKEGGRPDDDLLGEGGRPGDDLLGEGESTEGDFEVLAFLFLNRPLSRASMSS